MPSGVSMLLPLKKYHFVVNIELWGEQWQEEVQDETYKNSLDLCLRPLHKSTMKAPCFTIAKNEHLHLSGWNFCWDVECWECHRTTGETASSTLGPHIDLNGITLTSCHHGHFLLEHLHSSSVKEALFHAHWLFRVWHSDWPYYWSGAWETSYAFCFLILK